MKNFKKITLIAFVLIVFALPTFSFAQYSNVIGSPAQTVDPTTSVDIGPTVTSTNPGVLNTTVDKACGASTANIFDVLCRISLFLNKLIPIFISLGVIYFIYGVVRYFIGSDEEAKKAGKNRIIYGLIGFAVILSMWGLVTIIINSFGIDKLSPVYNNPASVAEQMSASKSGTSTFCPGGPLKKNPLIGDVINYVTCLIGQSIVPLIFTLATASFVWGVVQFVINDAEEAKKEKGRLFMIWGIIALAVMVSMWGLVGILGKTLNIDTKFVPQLNQK